MKKVLMLCILFIISCTSFAEFERSFMNNTTNAKDPDKETLFISLAKKINNASGINVYTNIIVTEEDDSTKAQLEFSTALDEIFRDITINSATDSKFIVILHSINSNLIDFKTNITDKRLNTRNMRALIHEYALPNFDDRYLPYVLDSKTGNISKMLNANEVGELSYLASQTYLMHIGFLKGLSNALGLPLKIPSNTDNLLKRESEMAKKINDYQLALSEEARKREEERLAKLAEEEAKKIIKDTTDIKVISNKEKELAEKERKKREAEQKEEEALAKAQKWNQGIKMNVSYNYFISEQKTNMDGKVANQLDPVTGLPTEVKSLEKYQTVIASLQPFLKSEENGEIVSSLSYNYKKDFLYPEDTEKNLNKFRFNYLSGKFLFPIATSYLVLGDVNIKKSDVIASKDYRGYYGSLKYFINGNPEKWSYKKEKEKALIEGRPSKYKDTQFTFQAGGLYAPKGGALGENISSQTETLAFLVEFANENYKDKDSIMNLGFVYGESVIDQVNKIKNSGQEFYLYSKGKLNAESKNNFYFPYYLKLKYASSLMEIENTETTEKTVINGDKLSLDTGLTTKYGLSDEASIQFVYDNTNPNFNTSLLSKTYNNNVPTYVSERTAIGQEGFTLKLKNTLFSKKIFNDIEFYSYEKKDLSVNEFGEETLAVYPKRGLNLGTDITISPITDMRARYKSIIDTDGNIGGGKKDETITGDVNQKYSLSILEKNKKNIEAIGFRGNTNPNILLNNFYINDEKLYTKSRIGLNNYGLLALNKMDFKDNYNLLFSLYNYKTLETSLSENISDVKITNVSTSHNFMFSDTSLQDMFNYTYFDKDNKSMYYTAIHNNLSQGINIDNEFTDLFNEGDKIRSNINMSNYSFKQFEKDPDLNDNIVISKDNYGNSLSTFIPINNLGIRSFNSLSFNSSTNKLENKESSNINLGSKNSKSINDKLDVYLDYDYKYGKVEVSTSGSIDALYIKNGDQNQENAETVIKINQTIESIKNALTENYNEREIHDIGTGIKYLLNDKNDKLQIKAVFGGGFEIYKNLLIEESRNYLYATLGSEIKKIFSEKNVILNKTYFKPYFGMGGATKVSDDEYIFENNGFEKYSIENEFSFLVYEKEFRNALKAKYKGTKFIKEQMKIFDEDSVKISLTGEFLYPHIKTTLQYSISDEYLKKTAEKEAKNTISYKVGTTSLLYAYAEKKQEITTSSNFSVTTTTNGIKVGQVTTAVAVKLKKEPIEFITNSTLNLSSSGNTVDDKGVKSSFHNLNATGAISFYKGVNTLSINGNIAKKDTQERGEEETSDITVTDTQKIFDFTLSNALSYSVNTLVDSSSKYKILKYSSTLNVPEIAIKGLTMSIGYRRELQKYPQDKALGGDLYKEVNAGSVSVNYAF